MGGCTRRRWGSTGRRFRPRSRCWGWRNPSSRVLQQLEAFCSNQVQHEEALGAYRKSLEIRLEVQGPLEHPDPASSYDNLGTLYNRQVKQAEEEEEEFT